MPIIQNTFQIIYSHVLPTACIVCQTFQGKQICAACLDYLANEQLSNYQCCRQCASLLNHCELTDQQCHECTQNPPYFDATYCLDRYEGRLQKSVHRLKYEGRLFYASGLALAWNTLALPNQKIDLTGYLLPVPLSQIKLCLRGFNQSWEIARKIDCGKCLQKNPHILMRHHHTHNQATETRASRQSMIKDVFFINPLYQKILEGQTIVVFDDVMTTGATLNEIARILKDNGVSRVINWVLLRTLHPKFRSKTSRANHV